MDSGASGEQMSVPPAVTAADLIGETTENISAEKTFAREKKDSTSGFYFGGFVWDTEYDEGKRGSSAGSSQGMRHVIMPLVALLLGSGLLLFSLGIIPMVLFCEETIDLSVHPGNIEVQAMYVLKNPCPFPIEQTFGLPFPVDSQHPTPVPVELFLAKTGKPVHIENWFDYSEFKLYFGPTETIPIVLYYRQATLKQDARYILTSTHSWQRPLSRGTYRLHCKGIKTITSNYPMKSRGATEWYWERTNFMPDYDWQIKWSKDRK